MAALSQLGSPIVASAHDSARPESISQAAPSAGAYFDHIVIIMMENQKLGEVYNITNAPYLKNLADANAFAKNYTECLPNSAGSLMDYMCATGARNYFSGTNGEQHSCAPATNPACRVNGTNTNIADLLQSRGLTWKAYMEDMTVPCYANFNVAPGNYSVEHNPFVYYTDIAGPYSGDVGTGSKCTINDLPSGTRTGDYSYFLAELNSPSPANYTWFSPNNCNNMHGAPACKGNSTKLGRTDCDPTFTCIRRGNNYLQNLVPKILSSTMFTKMRSALFITFDECSCGPPLQPVYSIWTSSTSKPTTRTNYASILSYQQHYPLMKTLELNWGLGNLTPNDLNAPGMTEFFTPEFTISATSPAAVRASVSATSTVTVAPLNGFTGNVSLTDTIPSGLACGAISPSIIAGGSGTATVSCSATAGGNYTLTVTGTSGSLTHSTTTIFRVQDFTVAASSPAAANVGVSVPSTITVTALNGFAGTVSLTDTVPSGLTCGAINPTSITGSDSAYVSCSATVAGNYTLTVTGTSSPLAHNATALFQFRDFTIVATPPPTVNAGTSATSTITIAPLNRFGGVVIFTDKVPSGLACDAITPGSLTGSGTATVSCSATVAGNYTLTITGTSSSLAHSVNATFRFQDFTIAATSPATVDVTVSTPTTITVTALNRFAGIVSLSDTVPSGLTCGAITPTSITGSGTATVSCTATVAGNYTLTVIGTSGSLTHSTTVTFRFQDFTVAASSPAAANVGVSVPSTITVTALNGFAGTVSLTDTVPSGLTCGAIAPTSVTGPGSATVSCSASVAGNYTLTLTGTSTPIVHTATVTFRFNDFTITATTPADFNKGGTGSSTVTVTPINGFSGKVTLTTTVAPSTGLTPNCPANLNVTIGSAISTCSPSSSSPGVYLVTITAASGGLTRTAWFISHVGDFSISATSPSGNAGFSITSNITSTSSENFAGSVALTNTAPAGLSCGAFSPTPVTLTANGTGTSKLSCTSATPGSFTVTINATGSPGTASHSTTATFTFGAFDFSITASSPADFNRGATGSSTITVTPIGNFVGIVTLTTTVSPSTGLSANCPATLIVTSGAVTGTCSPSASTPGIFQVNVTGTGGGHTHSAIFFSHVGEYSISTTSPTGDAGSLLNSTVTLTSAQNFAGSITLTDTVPSRLSCRVFSASPVTLAPNGTATSMLSCSSPVGGIFTVTISSTGSPGNASHSANATFTFADFTITATSRAPVNAGASANSTITIGALNGFTGTVTLTGTVPSGLSCGAITPSSIAVSSGNATVSCNATVAGNYNLTVTGTSGSLKHNATATFRFQDFTISASPTTVTVSAGAAATSSVTVTGLNGFAGVVSLATNSTSCNVTPTSVAGSGGSTLSCTFAASGIIHVTVTGTSSSLSHSATVNYKVQDFTLTASPTSIVVNAGSAGASAITVTPLQGFNGVVSFVTNSTACSVTPTSLSGSGSSTLSCTFASASTVHITITGTSSSRSHSANVTYTVQDFSVAASQTTVSVAVGQSGTSTLTISPLNGFTGTVALTSSASPSGLNRALTPANVTLGGSQNSTLTVRASTAGSYTVTVTAKSGPLSHNVTLTILISDRPLASVVVGLDGSLYWNTFSATGSATGWQPLGGSTPTTPTLCQSGPGSLELLVRGMDNGIYHKSFASGTWSSAWDSPGGATSDQPACAVLNGTLHIVVRGLDNVTYANSLSLATVTWSGWVNLNGQTPSAPVLVVTPSANRLDLVVRGLANGVYHKAFVNGAWTAPWDTPGGTTPDVPAIVSDGKGIDIVVRGMNNGLWYNFYNFTSGAWSNWFTIGGATATTPSLAINSSGTIHLLVTGLDNGIWHISRTAGGVWGSSWDSPGGATSNRLAVTTIGTNVIVLASGLDNGIYFNVLAGTSWQTWTPLGGKTLLPLALSSIP